MPSRYITTELLVSSMAAALTPYTNIDLAGFRLACYQRAGIPLAEAVEHDGEAWRREAMRRDALEAYVTGPGRRPIFAGLSPALAFALH